MYRALGFPGSGLERFTCPCAAADPRFQAVYLVHARWFNTRSSSALPVVTCAETACCTWSCSGRVVIICSWLSSYGQVTLVVRLFRFFFWETSIRARLAGLCLMSRRVLSYCKESASCLLCGTSCRSTAQPVAVSSPQPCQLRRRRQGVASIPVGKRGSGYDSSICGACPGSCICWSKGSTPTNSGAFPGIGLTRAMVLELFIRSDGPAVLRSAGKAGVKIKELKKQREIVAG